MVAWFMHSIQGAVLARAFADGSEHSTNEKPDHNTLLNVSATVLGSWE